MAGILAIALTVVLMYLYHKLFTVVYVNALAGIIREIVVCFVLAVIILGTAFKLLGIELDSKDSEAANPSAQVQTSQSPNRQKPSQNPPVKSFYGTFHNMALLNNGVFDAFIIIGDSEWSQGGISVFGYATVPGLNYMQGFNVDIPMPEGNTFTFRTDEIASTLTMTLHPDEYTLEIVQEPTTSDTETPFTGSYVDADTWNGLEDQWRAVIERNEELAKPNRWISDYAGSYILEAFVEGEEGAPYARFGIRTYSYGNTFRFSPAIWIGGEYGISRFDWTDYDIPFPLGIDDSKHIEYETDDGLIAFDVLDDKADGRHVIRVTACPYLKSTGVFVSGLEQVDSGLLNYGRRLTWPGNYVCESGGEDGTKSISISQVNDQLLSIEMVHNYADGRVETYHAEAETNAYGHGEYAAEDHGDKQPYFTLLEDPDTGRKAVRVQQFGINLSIDQEFDGTYFIVE